jgi:hypothetical protein
MSGPWERYKAQGSEGAKPWERYGKAEEEPGVLDVIQSYTTDIPVRAIKGALGGLEMATNVFGADNPVSQLLEGAQEGINEYLVSDTAKQRAAEREQRLEGKGFFGTLGEVPGILLSDPVLLFEALGTAAPTLGAAALTGGSSVAAQSAALLGSGALMGAGTVKGAIYDATKDELVKAGVSEKDAAAAADEAQSYAGENLDMIALGTALGAVASRTGMEPAAARIIAGRILGKSVSKAAGREALEGALTRAAEKGALRTAATEAVTEGGQGAQEQFAANLARKRQGADVDLMEGVGSAAALEGTLGGILGGGIGVAAKRSDIKQRLAAEEAAQAEITGEGPRAPQGFEREVILSRLGTAAGENPTGERMAKAVSRKVNTDLAYGTPERLAQTEAYLTDLEDKLDAGQLPEQSIDALRRPVLDEAGNPVLDEQQRPVYTGIIPETRSILSEFRKRAEAGPEPLNVESYVRRYMAGEGRGDSAADLEMQQFAANNPQDIEAEFARQAAAPAAASAVEVGTGPLSTKPLEPIGVTIERAAPIARPAPIRDVKLPEFDSMDKFWRLMNDRFEDAGKVTDFFKEATGLEVVPKESNLRQAFEQSATKRAGLQTTLKRNFFESITDELKTAQVPLNEVASILLARAAKDKNKAVAEVNAAFPEGGSGIDDAEADVILADAEARGVLPKLKNFFKKHDELVDYMGQQRVESGMLSQEEWNRLREAQPFYTPFKGFAVDDDMLSSALEEDPEVEAQRDRLMREKRGLGMREFFQAKGRESLPFHPLYNLFADAEALARRVAMNDVYRTFENMYATNPEAMGKFVKGIYSEEPVTTQGVFMGPKQIIQVSATDPAGKVVTPEMAREVTKNRSKYHVYKSNGITKYVEFDEDLEGGRAMKRLFDNLQPKEMGDALKAITAVNNALKAVLTYRNPIYLTLVAPLRDSLDAVATAVLNRNVKGSPAYKKKIARKVAAYAAQPAMWRTVKRYVLGQEAIKGRDDLMNYVDRMVKAGGAPMSVAFRTAQDHATDARKELDWFRQRQEGDSLAIAREGAAKVGRFFDHWAEINDIVPRLATFRAAVEEGISDADAASLALDSSLNITKRGEWSNVMDNIFPFFSASVEGTRKVGRIVKNPKTMAQVVGGMMAIGMMESLTNNAFGDDEDDDRTPDYLDVNPGRRMTNLVLFYGKGGDDYVTVPIGHMLGYFKYIGNKLTDVWLGVQSGEEAGAAIQAASADLVGGLIGLLSPARVQGGDLERTLVSLVPLWGKPIADLAINQNYFGSPIYQPEREDTGPAAELGRATTGEAWKSIARGLNEMTGGSSATGGYINFQPEVYKYILQTYLGGWARLGKQVFDFSEEPTGKNIPIVQGFLGKGFDYVPQNKYKQNTEKLSKIIARVDNMSDAQFARELERNPVALDPRIIESYQDIERELQRLYKQRREDQRVLNETEASESDKKALLEYYRIEMNKLWSAFNYTYDVVKDEKEKTPG